MYRILVRCNRTPLRWLPALCETPAQAAFRPLKLSADCLLRIAAHYDTRDVRTMCLVNAAQHNK